MPCNVCVHCVGPHVFLCQILGIGNSSVDIMNVLFDMWLSWMVRYGCAHGMNGCCLEYWARVSWMWSLVTAMPHLMLRCSLRDKGFFLLQVSWFPMTWMNQRMIGLRVSAFSLMVWLTLYSSWSMWFGFTGCSVLLLMPVLTLKLSQHMYTWGCFW